jgi:transcriptional regulator with XRE-family HTH domain
MSSIDAPISSIQASLSSFESGAMAPSNTVWVAGVLDMAETPEGFAQRLRELRKNKNLSQTELGQLAGLHYTHIGRFERGTSRPSGDTLKRVADALGVTSDYLLDGAATEAAKARFEDRELLKQFQDKKQLQALVR